MFPLSVRGQRCTLCNTVIPHFIVARPQGEGDYNVNHRQLHIGPCKCSQGDMETIVTSYHPQLGLYPHVESVRALETGVG